jgi:hypothetical protein
MFQLTDATRKKEFTFEKHSSYIEIRKIILSPLFKWEKPDDWSKKLTDHGLSFRITGYKSKGGTFKDSYHLMIFNNPIYYEPKFNLAKPLKIHIDLLLKPAKLNEFHIRVEIELMGSVAKFEFDVMFVYDVKS